MTDNRIFYPQQPILPTTRTGSAGMPNTKPAAGTGDFQKLLDKELNTVKFSQHALQRLQTRGIQFTGEQMDKLKGAVDKAAEKGAKESLVLMNSDLALVVSVKNRTVITAVDGASMKDNVFTNIDSAVIV